MRSNCRALMYHSVGSHIQDDTGAQLYTVSVERFREQMGLVKASSAIITFDDGFVDNYTIAYPILKELGLKAHFFVITSKIDSPGYMSWKQIKELLREGMTIGSHGVSHKILADLSDAELHYELGESKRILELNLGKKVEYFSIPKGHYSKKVINTIKEIGYKGVFTSSPRDNDNFKFGRIPIKENWDFNYFSKIIKYGLPLKDIVRELIKDTSKRALGATNYDRIRERALKDKK
jgi:peptidoglycan/xylan/chitin deacetylase (PgdA/CDA1 family)